MAPAATQADHRHRIANVIDHIFKNTTQDVPLETLATVAHYSPDHLQKLFKKAFGETPKQYGLQLRLEIGFHYLVVHPHRSIGEIAIESGFSSLSVFSRGVKNYFGHSPEQIRRLPHAQQMKLLHGAGAAIAAEVREAFAVRPAARFVRPEVRVVRRESIRGYYVVAPFNDPHRIREAFQRLSCFGCPPFFYGILTPHQRNTYRAFLPLPSETPMVADCPIWEIEGGTFATFSTSGDLRMTNKAAHYFYRQWLPASGYRIAGIAGFETFDESPVDTPYDQLTRHIFIPIEPNR